MSLHRSRLSKVSAPNRIHSCFALCSSAALLCLVAVLFAATALVATASSLSGGGSVDKPCIGIDLGTTYSVVGVWQKGGVVIVPNEMGNRITPSVVAFTDTERLVGDGAKNQLPHNPENTVFAVKRLIGRRFSDARTNKVRWLLVAKDMLPLPC